MSDSAEPQNFVATPTQPPRLLRWWRHLGIPKCEDTTTLDDTLEAWVFLNHSLIGCHPIRPDEKGNLGRIETQVHLDRRSLLAGVLRGGLNVTVQHNIFAAHVHVSLPAAAEGTR